MNREVHVRFSEGPRVKFPRSTQPWKNGAILRASHQLGSEYGVSQYQEEYRPIPNNTLFVRFDSSTLLMPSACIDQGPEHHTYRRNRVESEVYRPC
jgi:hypothetical protein